MDVILAFERVWVLLLVVDTLDLNRCVEQFVLATEQVRHLSQRLQGLE